MMLVMRLGISAAFVVSLGLAMTARSSSPRPQPGPLYRGAQPEDAGGTAASVASDDTSSPRTMTLEQAIERLPARKHSAACRARDYRSRSGAAHVAAQIRTIDQQSAASQSSRPLPGDSRGDRPTGQVETAPPPTLADRHVTRIEAARPRRVVEAQYQDAVRNNIDGVYAAFVDVEAMQEWRRRASANLARWDRLLEATETWSRTVPSLRAMSTASERLGMLPGRSGTTR